MKMAHTLSEKVAEPSQDLRTDIHFKMVARHMAGHAAFSWIQVTNYSHTESEAKKQRAALLPLLLFQLS
jgi:hypothetical protein